jgi:hypothetical protein
VEQRDRPQSALLHPKEDSTHTEMVVDPGDKTARDSRSAKDQSSPFNPLVFHRNVNPTLHAEDIQFSNEHGTEFSVMSDMATARPVSTGAASSSVITEVTVNRSGFIFDESNVRYLSVAELDKLSPVLRIARHEILARKGRFFKDPRLSVHFRDVFVVSTVGLARSPQCHRESQRQLDLVNRNILPL